MNRDSTHGFGIGWYSGGDGILNISGDKVSMNDTYSTFIVATNHTGAKGTANGRECTSTNRK